MPRGRAWITRVDKGDYVESDKSQMEMYHSTDQLSTVKDHSVFKSHLVPELINNSLMASEDY